MSNRLEGKNAVVTGAGRGIGREIALALAVEGAKVIVNDPGVARDGSGLSLEPADEVVELIKGRGGIAVANYESVADHAAAERIIKACLDNFGKIDILVNNAGIAKARMVFNMPEEVWDAVIGVHLKGTFNCTKHACICMKQQKSGRIINITSDAWRGVTIMGHSNYSAAKGGIVGFTRHIAREMQSWNVTCNAIAPRARTRIGQDEKEEAALQRRYEAGLITREQLDRSGGKGSPGPEFVPPIVVYLATDQAAHISGRVFGAGGGRITIFSEPEPMRSIYKDYQKQGAWTLDELLELVPQTLEANLPPLTGPA